MKPHASFPATAVVIAFALIVAGCKAGDVSSDAAPDPVSVRVADVTGGESVGLPLRFSGIVRATQRATLTFQVSGRLSERSVELGQLVAAGDVLARVYNPALAPARDSARARLAELNTQYEQAQREWLRSNRLHERGVVSEQSLEQLAARRDGLKASVATARAALAEATQLLDESTLRAPFAGRVEALLVEPDEFVAAGQPVMRLSSPEGREVEVRVPAYLLGHVELGQALSVWSVQDRSRPVQTGSVVEIAQAGAIRGELHPVLVSLPVNTLEPGEPVEVGITPTRASAMTVPLVSVMRTADGMGVFRVRDAQADRVPVTVDRIIGERAVVRSDHLQPGDQVVFAGMTRLTDGDRVEVR
ncbi:efflux RND transporter periplasmic adaptor subunit [Marinobacter salinisoli]|uniref:Efflux RND transporter periplasmic adaptor subunit n=1 Tax=Marinobacter salinisoli TaxID=2769486 RepID=A0ABX7MRL3_9GAMM|nr:efflux RND transporter periplasmic adaptor subunit [Marinobacter salinisoli]QSP94995.1 efflux RND transporter periplasmic adaptor subunit [Marinobacter salinisoli]